MEPMACRSRGTRNEAESRSADGDDALARYDDNRNGQITCKEVRRYGDRVLRPCTSRHFIQPARFTWRSARRVHLARASFSGATMTLRV